MPRRVGGRAALATAAALALGGCRGPAVQRYEDALSRTPSPAAHAVHDVRLGEVMRELDRLRAARLPTAIDPREEQERQAREVARIATSMAASAERIPDAAPVDLDPALRAEFDALAEALAQHCRALAAEARSASARERRRRLDRIDATCRACHERFRIPGLDATGSTEGGRIGDTVGDGAPSPSPAPRGPAPQAR